MNINYYSSCSECDRICSSRSHVYNCSSNALLTKLTVTLYLANIYIIHFLQPDRCVSTTTESTTNPVEDDVTADDERKQLTEFLTSLQETLNKTDCA